MKNKYISSGIKGYKTIHFKWHVNTQCKYRCDYCYYINSLNKIEPQSNRESYIGVLKRLSLKSIPNFIIDLLGGEPTLHDNIDEILNTLSDNTRLVVYPTIHFYMTTHKINPNHGVLCYNHL